MRLVLKSSKGKDLIVGFTYQNFLGYDVETGRVLLSITEGTGPSHSYYIEMAPDEALHIASYAIGKIMARK